MLVTHFLYTMSCTDVRRMLRCRIYAPEAIFVSVQNEVIHTSAAVLVPTELQRAPAAPLVKMADTELHKFDKATKESRASEYSVETSNMCQPIVFRYWHAMKRRW